MRSFAEMKELIEKSQAGDGDARAQLVEENMGLVHSVAKRFVGRGAEYEDLCQIGTIGLMQAIDRFDISLDFRFSTYAVTLIMGEIKRFLRDDGMVKVSRNLKETAQKVRAARETLEKELSREPKLSEIAQRVGISQEQVVLSLEATQPTQSLQAAALQEEQKEVCLMDRVCVDTDKTEALIDRLALSEVIQSFLPQERKLIILRYFKQRTQTQTAGQLGISQVSVSRMEKKILLKLKEKLAK